MLRATLLTLRGSAGRLSAAGLAIVLGTAFVTAVLLASGLLTRTVEAAVSASYAGADVVIGGGGDLLDGDDLAAVRALPGAAGADGQLSAYVDVTGGGRTQFLVVEAVPTTAELSTAELADGVLPAAAGTIALPQALAEDLGLAVGDAAVVEHSEAVSDDPDAQWLPVSEEVEVVGLLAGGLDSVFGATGTGLVSLDQAVQWSSAGDAYDGMLVVAADGTSPEQLRDQAAQLLAGTSGTGAEVLTAADRTQRTVDEFVGQANVLLWVVLAFAGLALFVAATVIANTFSVLVAQRTRQLALLRCVGATTRQVRASVLGEALVLGVVASLVGVLAGTALATGAAAVLARVADGVPVPSTVPPTLVSTTVPIALGVLATVLAALAPARAATRVAPLAALRPAEAPSLRARASRWRLAASLLLVVGGGALLAGGVVLAITGTELGILAAMGGGMLSFVGVLLGAVFIVPRVVGALGRLAAVAGGGPARVAAANAVRNPRRTASTTSALLIGVTLVSLMTVGAASTSATLDAELREQWPVDVSVGEDAAGPVPAGQESGVPAEAALDPRVLTGVRAVDGVARVVPLTAVRATTDGTAADPVEVTVRGVDPEEGRSVVVSAAALAPLAPGVLVVPEAVAADLGAVSGQELDLVVGDRRQTFTAQVTPLPGSSVVAAADDVAALAPQAPTTRLWAALAPGLDAAGAADAVGGVQAAVGDVPDAAVPVYGAAVERAGYQQVIDTLLLVVVALLAVAVVIAVIGVANTLSLSVIERTRESALMRALGLTRGQLRGMLALEGALVAGVGGLLGVVLGTVYGWLGAASLLGGTAGGLATLALPWERLGAVLVVALLAGLLASVLPGRRAARTPPVAALAE